MEATCSKLARKKYPEFSPTALRSSHSKWIRKYWLPWQQDDGSHNRKQENNSALDCLLWRSRLLFEGIGGVGGGGGELVGTILLLQLLVQ